jgi:hypothetical protein
MTYDRTSRMHVLGSGRDGVQSQVWQALASATEMIGLATIPLGIAGVAGARPLEIPIDNCSDEEDAAKDEHAKPEPRWQELEEVALAGAAAPAAAGMGWVPAEASAAPAAASAAYGGMSAAAAAGAIGDSRTKKGKRKADASLAKLKKGVSSHACTRTIALICILHRADW